MSIGSIVYSLENVIMNIYLHKTYVIRGAWSEKILFLNVRQKYTNVPKVSKKRYSINTLCSPYNIWYRAYHKTADRGALTSKLSISKFQHYSHVL